jgi:hypothetical protein
MMEMMTPRWLVTFLSWVPAEAGTYRVNKVKPTRPGTRTVECSPDEEIDLPEIYVDYEEKPREYTLNAVTTVLDVQTRISDLYRSPHDQIREQLRLMIEKVKERQENELVNNTEYGLLNNVAPELRVKTREHPRLTTSTNYSQRSGRSRLFSWRTPEPSRLSGVSAPEGAFHHQRSICLARIS